MNYHQETEGSCKQKICMFNRKSAPQSGEQMILGVRWHLGGWNELVIDVQKTELLTKRGIVGIISRIFDTIGIMLPATIKLHKAKIEWNSSIEGEH